MNSPPGRLASAPDVNVALRIGGGELLSPPSRIRMRGIMGVVLEFARRPKGAPTAKGRQFSDGTLMGTDDRPGDDEG
jgi:hypothetical protein